MDHLDVEFGAFDGWVVEAADIVEEVAGEGAMRVDGCALKAKVVVILRDLLVYGGVVDGYGNPRDFGSGCAFGREETAIDVVVECGWNDVVIGGDELDTCLIEREGSVAVVGDDDTDGDEAVLDVLEAKEVAVFRVVAGLGGDGDVLVGMSVESGVLIGWFGWWGLLVGCEGVGGD